MEIMQKKSTRDALVNEVKALEARITQQWKTIQVLSNEINSISDNNARLLQDLEQLKTINEAQSVHEGVSRVRLSMMLTEVCAELYQSE